MVIGQDKRSARLDEPTRSMLAGVSTLHALTIAIDDSGSLRWISDPLDLLGVGREGEFVGRPVTDLREALAGSGGDAGDPRIHYVIERLTAPEPASHSWLAGGRPGEEIETNRFDAVDATGARLRIVVSRRASANADRSTPAIPGTAQDTNDDPTLKALERKNDELETCLRSVSHDLRSPLVSLLGFTRLLRDDFGDPIGRTGRHFLDRIEEAGRNMERLLHDMLELTRIAEKPYCPVRVDPLPVLEELGAELKLQLDEAGIELHLPAAAPILLCDRTRLYQLFSNLIGNAIRHMEPNSSGRIDVSIDGVSDGWEITVQDNGPGIAPEDSARIFEAFQTARRPGPAKQSSGLGLAIVRKIVEAHHGHVRVESELGTGARFVIWLPRG